MAKPVVVEGDPVDGTDTHGVEGKTTSSPPAPWTGFGDYAYKGEVSGGLSDVVTVGGKPLALVTSASTLRAADRADHTAVKGGNLTPAPPAPLNPADMKFDPDSGVGDGKPSEGAGSTLLTVNGVKVLLDGDRFDTCGISGGTKKATVAATGQDLVTCSA